MSLRDSVTAAERTAPVRVRADRMLCAGRIRGARRASNEIFCFTILRLGNESVSAAFLRVRGYGAEASRRPSFPLRHTDARSSVTRTRGRSMLSRGILSLIAIFGAATVVSASSADPDVGVFVTTGGCARAGRSDPSRSRLRRDRDPAPPDAVLLRVAPWPGCGMQVTLGVGWGADLPDVASSEDDTLDPLDRVHVHVAPVADALPAASSPTHRQSRRPTLRPTSLPVANATTADVPSRRRDASAPASSGLTCPSPSASPDPPAAARSTSPTPSSTRSRPTSSSPCGCHARPGPHPRRGFPPHAPRRSRAPRESDFDRSAALRVSESAESRVRRVRARSSRRTSAVHGTMKTNEPDSRRRRSRRGRRLACGKALSATCLARSRERNGAGGISQPLTSPSSRPRGSRSTRRRSASRRPRRRRSVRGGGRWALRG